MTLREYAQGFPYATRCRWCNGWRTAVRGPQFEVVGLACMRCDYAQCLGDLSGRCEGLRHAGGPPRFLPIWLKGIDPR